MIFFVTRDGKQIDEYEKPEFHSKLLAGEILTTDHYWVEGMTDWRPISEYTIGMPTMKMDLTPSIAPASEAASNAPGPGGGAMATITDWLRRRR